jgi:hypothetical protein
VAKRPAPIEAVAETQTCQCTFDGSTRLRPFLCRECPLDAEELGERPAPRKLIRNLPDIVKGIRVAGTSFADPIAFAVTDLDVNRTGTERFGGAGLGKWFDNISLIRDPNNEWDANAIRVYYKTEMLGHVPREIAARLAPELDDGVEWKARCRFVIHPEHTSRPGVELAIKRLG